METEFKLDIYSQSERNLFVILYFQRVLKLVTFGQKRSHPLRSKNLGSLDVNNPKRRGGGEGGVLSYFRLQLKSLRTAGIEIIACWSMLLYHDWVRNRA